MNRIAARMHYEVESLEPRRLLQGVPFTFGGPNIDSGYQVRVDGDGNTIVAGIFSTTADFDPSKSSVFNLRSSGQSDGFVAKYAGNGKLIWARQFGGGAGDIGTKVQFSSIQQTVGDYINQIGPSPSGCGEYVNGLAIGPNNSIYVAGGFLGTCNFNPGPNGVNIRVNGTRGMMDAYVLQLNSDGSFGWAKTIGGEFEDVAKSIAVDANGNSFITGRFTRTANFNPAKNGAPLKLTASGRDDCFVMELSGNGKIVFANRIGGQAIDYNQRDSGEDIALDSAGNIYVTGTFAGRVNFNPNGTPFKLESSGDTDTFILKLNSSGGFVWAERMGGDHFDGGVDIAVASDGSIYTAGYFSRTADLDPAPDKTLNFTAFHSDNINGVRTNMYVSKLTSDGALIWAQQLANDGYGWMGRLAVDSNDNVYVTGAWSGTLSFNFSSATPTTLTSVKGVQEFPVNKDRKYSFDIFAAVLNSSGTTTQVGQWGSTSDDFGVGVALDQSENPVFTGRFKGTVNFGTASSPMNKKSAGQDDVFVLDDPELEDAAT